MKTLLASLLLLLLIAAAPASADTHEHIALRDGRVTVETQPAGPFIIPGADGGLTLLVRHVGPVRGDRRPPLRLHLRNGDVLAAESLAGAGDDSLAAFTVFGTTSVPLDDLWAVTRDGATDPDPTPPASDEVLLANGDRVTGFFDAYRSDGLAFDTDDGPVVIPHETWRTLRLADTGQRVPADEGAVARLFLHDGSRIAVERVRLGDGRVTFDANGRTADQPATLFAGVERLGGNARFLLDGTPPADASHTPYLSAAAPPRVTHPLNTFGDAPERSVVVRPHGHAAFDLPAGFGRLVVSVTLLPEPSGLADADVRVLLDDVVAYERPNLRPGEVLDLDLPLADASRVTFEADYGRHLDVGDRVAFVRPVLVRAAAE